ncbi:uncharacterized protein LACBIDRAFT_303811 [Laccaria bicolor S238N-H82]|uniref:Predicted protein n=1 Tax=Laccaria bicolor (strain S238N-H82 / ATCC MYA-4686) TaxID=486041 RepID=B0DKD5_LACBS|nr:uncharacterized protein LACBIDRAFT_303811 [Laccaria bicolor S238N-H82]EDR04925.1 predicted protein [Laccaria bicolor S238N-H82]|eukprot:XP_001884315.1 predicted protein [Laccaria bicolor S238N-H82]
MSPIPSIWVALTPRVLADNRPGMIELPSSIKHKDIWAYLALTSVILVITLLLAYLVYSCYAVSNRTPIASATPADHKPRKERKKPNRCRSDSQRMMMMSNASQVSVNEPTFEHDQYSVSIPPLAVTTTSPLNYGRPVDKPVDHSSHSYETPRGLDSHNIRYIPPITSCSPPAVVMIWNDPKLSPIHGSIVMSPFDDGSDNTTILGAVPACRRSSC